MRDRKLLWRYIILGVLLNFLAVSEGLSQIPAAQVGIQAGHWEAKTYTGATSSCDPTIEERDINFQIANRVADFLNIIGYDVTLLSAANDPNDWLSKGFSADVFVSIHVIMQKIVE